MQYSLKSFFVFLLFTGFLGTGCKGQEVHRKKEVQVGASKTALYLPLLKNKNVAVVANQTSVLGSVHLVDTLLTLGISIKKVFAPEHGFRGVADAGEHVKSGVDKKTGLPIISLYGNHKKPRPSELSDIDVVIFDIQDVGVRFYTYISTMHYVMEACAENNKLMVILDRPNPNGFYVDGPVLEKETESFVGMHPIPLVHGLTVGELAQMINGEGWLTNGIQCKLELVLCENYDHNNLYQLPIKPSPNLPNMASVYLYPSLGLFEGTVVSVGRGTEWPFQVIGHPTLKNTTFSFTPISTEGAKEPLYQNKLCLGFDLREIGEQEIINYKKIYLNWITGTYANSPDKSSFFLKNGFIHNLAGTRNLQKQIETGLSEKSIRESWSKSLSEYMVLRKKYLLYPDFEHSQ